MQSHIPPRRDINTLISNIRNMAHSTCKEVTSNPQAPALHSQSIQNPTNPQMNQVSAGPVRTQMTNVLRNINATNPSFEIGNLVEGIHKAHAKVDQVIRSIPAESQTRIPDSFTNENYLTINSQTSERIANINKFAYNGQEVQVKSLNELTQAPSSVAYGSLPNIASLQDFTNAEPFSSMNSLRNITSNRPINLPAHSSQFYPLQQHNKNNPFLKNTGPSMASNPLPSHNVADAQEYESTLIKMIPLECDPIPTQSQNLLTQETFADIYPNKSLNEIQDSREDIESNRPKSLLYTSNYTKHSQNKAKRQLQYPPASVVKKNSVNSQEKKSDAIPSRNLEEASEYFENEQEDYYGFKGGKTKPKSQKEFGLKEVNQNEYVEKIMRKLKSQENNYKKQMQEIEKQVKHIQTPLEVGGNVNKRIGRTYIQNENSYKEAPSIEMGHISSNNISETSIKINSRYDIEKKIEMLGKESAKPKPKRVIPSLGGGALVYEKKENEAQKNTQVFGKEVRSGGYMGSLAAKRTSSGNVRNNGSKEFVKKDPNQRRSQGYDREDYGDKNSDESDDQEYYEEDEEYEYEDNSEEEDQDEEEISNGNAEAYGGYFGEENQRKYRQPGQEEQDSENNELHRSEFILKDGRSRIENGDMVWSSHKKSRMVGYMY